MEEPVIKEGMSEGLALPVPPKWGLAEDATSASWFQTKGQRKVSEESPQGDGGWEISACQDPYAHPLQCKEEMPPILFRMLLWFFLEYICALDKRLGPYILEKITGEGQPSLQLIAGMLLRRWPMDWTVGRRTLPYSGTKIWAWIQQPRHTGAPATWRQWEILILWSLRGATLGN